MDPITAALTLITTIAKFYLLLAESADPETRAALAKMWVEDMTFWRGVLHQLIPKA